MQDSNTQISLNKNQDTCYDADKNKFPIISIIVPVYKVEKYLHRCLDSIIVQTFTDWECILIDDGSPDNSGAICDEYASKDSRFKVIHQENKGVSAARNAGLDAAKGTWIGFVDSDDWVEPRMYQLLYQGIETSNVDIITCNCFLEQRNCSIEKNVFTFVDAQENLYSLVMSQRQGWLFICLFRREIIASYNIRFPSDIGILEDEIFQIEFFLHANKAFYIPEYLYHYNLINENSATYSFNKEKAFQIIMANEKIYNIAKKNNLNDFEAKLNFRFAKSKCWFLRKTKNLNTELITVWNGKKLYKADGLSNNQRTILLLAEYNFKFGIYLLRALSSFLEKIRNRLKND